MRPHNARRATIEAELDELLLLLLVIDFDSAGNVVAISINSALKSVRLTWLKGLGGGEWGVLIGVETSVNVVCLVKLSVVTIVEAGGALLAECATAIGGNAYG